MDEYEDLGKAVLDHWPYLADAEGLSNTGAKVIFIQMFIVTQKLMSFNVQTTLVTEGCMFFSPYLNQRWNVSTVRK